MKPTRFSFEVQPKLPDNLSKLEEWADNLLYTWDRSVRGLFFRLDRELWEASGHNPKVFLRRVSQQKLDEAAEDRIFLEDYNRVISFYETYYTESIQSEVSGLLDPEKDLVAYFCAEFGFHESVPLYSGGLGILAGDHCKAASDLVLPFVAVGLLYRRGYFKQTIDGQGKQIAHYARTNFQDLPVTPAVDAKGNDLVVRVEIAGRIVVLKVWRATAGHITLYLLDSDLEENSDDDRRITYELYGGNSETRVRQEIVLGIGGVRALRALGYAPTVWHINEGHAAFLVLERVREHIGKGLEFESALELVAAGTVFTTHTPVAAGHDIFEPALFARYFAEFADSMGVPLEVITKLGTTPNNHGAFNMTALALRGSRFHNGVSRIHGGVASQMEAYVWPQIPHDENPIGHVTNGVHVPTFLAREWANTFDMRFDRTWRNELPNEAYWGDRVDDIPDQNYWSVRQTLKSMLLEGVRERAKQQHRRNGVSDVHVQRLIRHLVPEEPDVLTFGFARRFATYKRATLLFSDPERLNRLVNDPDRPVLLLFAGKAHPKDDPGQSLISTIYNYSRRPEFEGKIVLLEDFNLALARKLVAGVDVWINTPEHPLEASGTSGQKAGINGVINLSILDGWWGEGYNGENGWAITPHDLQCDPEFRDKEEAQALLDIIEHHVIPLYYDRNGHGYPEQWVQLSKASMKSIIPHFNAKRMVTDYVRDYYHPAALQHSVFARDDAAPARELAQWKARISEAWGDVALRCVDDPPQKVNSGDTLPIHVIADLKRLAADDVRVECQVGIRSNEGKFIASAVYAMEPFETDEQGSTEFRLDLKPELPGLQEFQIRMYPHHPNLSHPFETGYMIWL